MVKLDKLIEIASTKSLDVMALEYDDFYEWSVRYLNYKKAGLAPILEYCRDQKDYELRTAAWIKDGTEISPKYSDFDMLLTEEIKRLRKL